jgi:hypothetical protein
MQTSASSLNFILFYDTDRMVNTESNSSSIVACIFVAAGNCLSSRCLATAVSSGSTVIRGDTQTVGWSHKPTSFFQNKESRLKILSGLLMPVRVSPSHT